MSCLTGVLLFRILTPLTTIVSPHCTCLPLPQLPSLTSLDFSQHDTDPRHNYLPSRRLRSVTIVISPQPKRFPSLCIPKFMVVSPFFTVVLLSLWLSPFLSVWLLALINGSLPLPLMSPLSAIVSPYRRYVYPLTSAALGVVLVDFIGFSLCALLTSLVFISYNIASHVYLPLLFIVVTFKSRLILVTSYFCLS